MSTPAPSRASAFDREAEISVWFTENWTEIAIAFAIGVLAYVALRFAKGFASARARKAADQTSIPALIWRVVSRTREWVLLVVAARIVAENTAPPPLIDRVIEIIFTIGVVYQGAIWAREAIIGLIQRKAGEGEHETLENALVLIRILVSFAVFAIALIVVLDNLGVDVTGLVAGLGIGGIAIGLAAQGIFSDLFAALAVIFDKPFKRGETIQFDDMIATVETIGLKSTRLRAVTGEEVILSNTNLLDKQIVNYTRLNRRRTRFTIGVIYQTTPEVARSIPGLLEDIVKANGDQFVRSGFVGFGASSLDFQLDFDTMSDDYEIVFAARHAIGLAIVEEFNARKIEFAYPTQTTFQAAPDGRMIYPMEEPPREAGAPNPAKTSKERSN